MKHSVNSALIDVSVSGMGVPPIVWTHGLLSSIAQDLGAGNDVLGPAEDRHIVARYDTRGHGASSGGTDADAYRWPALASDMWGVADACGFDQVIVGGASMGAATALYAALREPARTSGLILMCLPTAWQARPADVASYARTAARLTSPLARLKAAATGADAGARMRMAAALRGAAASDLPSPAELRTIACPALLLGWPDDAGHPLATAEALAGLLPTSKLDISERAGPSVRWPDLIAEFFR